MVPGTVFSYEHPAGSELSLKAGVDRGNELKITKEIAAYDSDSKASLGLRCVYCSARRTV